MPMETAAQSSQLHSQIRPPDRAARPHLLQWIGGNQKQYVSNRSDSPAFSQLSAKPVLISPQISAIWQFEVFITGIIFSRGRKTKTASLIIFLSKYFSPTTIISFYVSVRIYNIVTSLKMEGVHQCLCWYKTRNPICIFNLI